MWNLIGIFAWLIVLALLIFVVLNIRGRHLRQLVYRQKKISAGILAIDFAEMIALIAVVVGMLYVSFFTKVDTKSSSNYAITYKYEPLRVETDATGKGYYVKIDGDKSSNIDVYKYRVEDSNYSVSSQYATLSDATMPLNVPRVAMKWNKKDISKYDNKYTRAYVITGQARYKKNFINGLGMNAGKLASEYRVIRVPDRSFIKTDNK
ncbi:LVIS_2131 family protein [Companilactobacillus metriopterae]|uniref:LVIS_2131 family protein n=1 Tax=Companilactobacillus metriopterae TaxID=1909267 RepID=UPI001F5129E0|nr:LVIS_2131 family protein [Companilactobacillus metriopterae]